MAAARLPSSRRFVVALCAALLATLALAPFDAKAATTDFVADATIRQVAETSAAEAVQFAKRQFNLVLDGNEASIDDVERVLDSLHTSYALASPKPPDGQLLPLARMLGAYVGEVYRRNHGATWGTVTLNGSTYPGLRTDGGVNVWITGRVLNRIIDGPDSNIAFFYRKLVADSAQPQN
jgi:hypothetical protein